jgi:hypothetical protein
LTADGSRAGAERISTNTAETVLVRGAARLLAQDLGRMKGLCQTALKRHEWWWKDLEASPRMSGEERLLLARHLNDEQ